MDSVFFNAVVNTVRKLVNLICEASRERIIQDLLADGLRAQGIRTIKRALLRSEHYPEMEADLLEEGGAGVVEVKVGPRFYEGLGQVLVLRELYGREPVLLQVFDELNERIVNALRLLRDRYRLKVILVDRRNRRVQVLA